MKFRLNIENIFNQKPISVGNAYNYVQMVYCIANVSGAKHIILAQYWYNIFTTSFYYLLLFSLIIKFSVLLWSAGFVT